MIANRKNRIEKGKRADLIGSNPHSKGEFFSRSPMLRFANNQPRNITTLDNTMQIKLPNNDLPIGIRDTIP